MPFKSTSNQTGFTSHLYDLTAYNNNNCINNNNNINVTNVMHSNNSSTHKSLTPSTWTFGNQSIENSNQSKHANNNQRMANAYYAPGFNHLNGSYNVRQPLHLNNSYGHHGANSGAHYVQNCDRHYWLRHRTSKINCFLVDVIAHLTNLSNEVHFVLNVIIGISLYYFIYMYFF